MRRLWRGCSQVKIPKHNMALLSSFYPQPVVKGTTAGTYAEGNDPRFGDGLAEAPEDGIIYGRKDADWVDITEPANLQIRRGTAAEVNAITPLEGEPVWETDAKKLVVGDGATVGGFPVSRFPLDATLRNQANPTNPLGGSIFVGEDVDNRGGSGPGKPFVAGNARGASAVDLQLERSVATRVASGSWSSILGGANNTAAASYSSIIASSGSSIDAGASYSVAIGCASKTITSNFSFCHNSSSSASNTFGSNAILDRQFMSAFGSSGSLTGFGGGERAQAVQFILKGRTTNATATQLVVNIITSPSFITSYLTIPLNVALFGTIEICAVEEVNATAGAHYLRKFAIQNLAGTTSLIGSVTAIGTDEESNAGYGVEVSADNSTSSLRVDVTGDPSKTLRWVAVVRGTEIEIS